ncbi:MAG: hypothetical protein QME51_10235 [Planctomycetota bacterium]|nr:hypothetical protein [Planctomycetota bacterium]
MNTTCLHIGTDGASLTLAMGNPPTHSLPILRPSGYRPSPPHPAHSYVLGGTVDGGMGC